VESSRVITSLEDLATSQQTRRAALRRLGLGGVAAGLLSSAGAPASRAQTWELATATPESAPATPAAAPPPLAGVSGGLPPFVFDLEQSEAIAYDAGAIHWATRRQFPVLQGVSMVSQRVMAGGVRELHWHLNANELSYCLSGHGRIGIFAPDGSSETIDIQPGSITFVPVGYTHYIQNSGGDELHMVIAFDHEQPETANLSAALPGIPTSLLAQNFGVPANDFPFLTTQGDRLIVPLAASEGETAATPIAPASSAYSINADQLPVSQLAGGTVQPLSSSQIARLKGITLFPLSAVPHGLREPHWHANAGELNYLISGRAQIGLVAPDGNVQTVTVSPGAISFLPANWLHYIVSVSDEPLQYLIFFVTADAHVETIGLAQTFGYFPPAILAASFGIDPALFAALPEPQGAGIMPPVTTE
jgi:oxalate decarboxylase